MRIALVALLVASTARADDTASRKHAECVIRAGPNDRIAQNEAVVVEDGERIEDAVAVRGDVVVRRGGKVVKAIALGGDVVLEQGARVTENAVAVGGDVKVANGARIEGDALALGGQVRMARGATIGGTVLGLSLQLGRDLQSKILSELKAEGSSCRIEREPERPSLGP